MVKKDGRREPFERGKVLRGLERACNKRPVSAASLEAVADRIEREVYDRGEPEVQAGWIGERVMDELRALDPVAYVRFASVYRDFQDLTQFQELLEKLRAEPRRRTPRKRTAEGRNRATNER